LVGVLREGAWGESRCADGQTTNVSTNHRPHKSQQWSIPTNSSYFRQLFDFYYQTNKAPLQKRIYSVTTHSTSKRCAIYCTALSEQIISNEMRPPTDLRTNTTKRRMEQYKYSQSHKNAAAALYQEEKPSMPSGLETLLNDITA